MKQPAPLRFAKALFTRRPFQKPIRNKGIFITLAFVFSVASSGYSTVYRVSSYGNNPDASTFAGLGTAADTLIVDDTVLVTSNTTWTWNFSTVTIQQPAGCIYWRTKGTVSLPNGVSFVVDPGASGLQPTGSSALKLLEIGGIKTAASNANSTNAAFSFAEFNAQGGLPLFILTVSANAICGLDRFSCTITPLNTALLYKCLWSVTPQPAKGPTPASARNFNTAQTTLITPGSFTTYTVSCTIFHQTDNDPIVTKTISVTVNPRPTGSLSGTQRICSGEPGTLVIDVTGTGTLTGNLSDGTGFSGIAPSIFVNVNPSVTTTYKIKQLDDANCSSLTTDLTGKAKVIVPTGTPGDWTGEEDKDWFNCHNWADGKIPTGSVDVRIPGTVGLCVINKAGATCRSLVIDGGTVSLGNGSSLTTSGDVVLENNGTLDMTAGGSLDLQGDWTNTVTTAGKGFKPGTGKIIFSGPATQGITSSNGTELYYDLQINKAASSDLVNLNNDITVGHDLTLTQGIITTGYHLFTWNNDGGTLTAPEPSYSTNSQNYTKSFIATCDASGDPIVVADATTPFTGNTGFRIKNVGNKDTYFPVGATYKPAGLDISTPAPNRMMINNQYQVDGVPTPEDFTVVVNYGDIGYTDGTHGTWRVNRIWYVKASLDTGVATMQLFFTKRNTTTGIGWPAGEDEVEAGFSYGQAALVQKDYSGDPLNFINLATFGDFGNFLNNGIYPYGSEVYGQYRIGISKNRSDGIQLFNRFSIVNPQDIVLPVTVINLVAGEKGTGVEVRWTALNETNIDHYEIQRSSDAVHFTGIGNVAAFNNGSSVEYTRADPMPLTGNNYYRIKITDRNGSISYTAVVNVIVGVNKASIEIHPNPVYNKQLTIQLRNLAAGKYQLLLVGRDGKAVFSHVIEHGGGTAAAFIALPENLVPGAYFMKLFNGTSHFTSTIVIE